MEQGKPKRRPLVPPSLMVLTVSLLLLPLGATRLQKYFGASSPTFPNAELAALDAVVQARLAEVPADGRFGISRMSTPEDRFLPVSPREELAINHLRSAGLTVYLFTAGRHKEYDRSYKTSAIAHHVSGPVAISQWPVALNPDYRHPHFASRADRRRRPPADLPSIKDLTARASQLLDGRAPNQAVRFASGRWNVAMTPVWGNEQSCVNCHNQMLGKTNHLRQGDAMGAAIYVWKTSTSGLQP
jgi:hypothetical protein